MTRRRVDDHELWERVKATVKPMQANRSGFEEFLNTENSKSVLKTKSSSPKPKQLSISPSPSMGAKITVNLVPQRSALDPKISRRIAKGRISLEGRIDLHGMNQMEAHERLWRFLDSAYAMGKRTVLVITGKGAAGGGVLKRAVPQWLEAPDFKSVVSGYQESQKQHGGSGALYVRLRNNRGRTVS